MNNHFMITDDMLWDYADNFLSAAEKQQVEAYLAQHPEWQTRLGMILHEKQELHALSLESPAPGFTDRVMAAWATEQVKQKASAQPNDWIIRLIALVFGLFILTPVVVMVVAVLQAAPGALPSVALPELPVVRWETWIASPILQYGLMLLLAFAGLRFMDKLLQHRRLAHELEF